MENLHRSAEGTYCTLHIAHCSLGIWSPPTAGSWRASTVYRPRIGTMNLSLPSNWQLAIGNRQSEGSWGGIQGEGPCFFHRLRKFLRRLRMSVAKYWLCKPPGNHYCPALAGSEAEKA